MISDSISIFHLIQSSEDNFCGMFIVEISEEHYGV